MLETLENLAPPAAQSLRLAKATPDPERAQRGQVLPIRYREKEVDR
jgi:hypothetical protein